MIALALGWRAAVGFDCLGWALWGLATGWFVSRIDVGRLGADTWITRGRAWERAGRVYLRVLRIGRWQRVLPEAGAVLFGGVDKRHIGGRSSSALALYAAETRRAEYVHWLGLAVSPFFALWNPGELAAAMLAYALVANVPCLISLRSNRLRIVSVLDRRARPNNGSRLSEH